MNSLVLSRAAFSCARTGHLAGAKAGQALQMSWSVRTQWSKSVDAWEAEKDAKIRAHQDRCQKAVETNVISPLHTPLVGECSWISLGPKPVMDYSDGPSASSA